MKSLKLGNPVYALTVCLWLTMGYLAWNLGYEVGQSSVNRGRVYDGRPVQDHPKIAENDSDRNSKNDESKTEHFPRPCEQNRVSSTNLKEIVIFGSVPKCGGRTLLSLMFALSQPNDLKVKSALNYSLENGSEVAPRQYINRMIQPFTKAGFLYTNARFVQADTVQSTALLRIGLIRDPMQRLVSSFYHRRFGDRLTAKTVDDATWERHLKAKSVDINEIFDDCVKNKMSECVAEYTKGTLVKQFCGYHSDCKTASPAALLRAKNNVRNNYLVVGILEEIDDFVRVLEKIRPSLFQGAFDKLENDERIQSVIKNSRTVGLQSVSELTKGIIKKHLAIDYEFYYFIQWRFLKQKEECGV